VLPKNLKAGSEIVHYCNSCKWDLGHTVIAMIGSTPARVRCNTCKAERNYKSPSQTKTREILRERPKKVTGSHSDFYREKLQSSSGRESKNYRIDIPFEVGDKVNHKKFGLGVVLKVIPPDRVEIIFQDELKVLACKQN